MKSDDEKIFDSLLATNFNDPIATKRLELIQEYVQQFFDQCGFEITWQQQKLISAMLLDFAEELNETGTIGYMDSLPW